MLEELRESGGLLSERTRESLALEAFGYTARYDAAISRWFAEREADFPAQYARTYEKVLDLPYGENPHQRAAYYAEAGARTHLLSMVSKLHGKELSFNNLLDLDAAPTPDRRVRAARRRPSSSTTTRAAARWGRRSGEAFERALATDRTSAFGGVMCFNRKVDAALAEQLGRDVRRARVRARLRRRRARGPSAEAERAASSRTASGASRR